MALSGDREDGRKTWHIGDKAIVHKGATYFDHIGSFDEETKITQPDDEPGGIETAIADTFSTNCEVLILKEKFARMCKPAMMERVEVLSGPNKGYALWVYKSDLHSK